VGDCPRERQSGTASDELTVEGRKSCWMSYGWKGNEWRRMTGKPRWRHFRLGSPLRRRAPARLVALPILPRATDGVRRTIDGVVKRPSEEASSTRQSQRETATNHEGTSSDGESADESTSGESDTHEQKSPSSTSEDDESREETTRRKTLIHQSPQFRIDRRRVTSAGA